MVFTLLIASIFIMILHVMAACLSYRAKDQSRNIVVHQYKNIQLFTQLLAELMDVETSQREYLISGDSAFLTSYQTGLDNIRAQTATLKASIHDHPSPVGGPEQQMISIANARCKDLEEELRLFKRFNRDSLKIHLAVRHGNAKPDALPQVVSAMVAPTNADLGEQDWFLQNSRILAFIRIASFLLLILTCSLALRTIVKKARSNARLLSKLKSSNRQLEHTVKKRTEQLEEAIRMKDHFLGVATHDLKAPLSSILGLVELIKIDNSNLSVNEAEYLAHIEYSCRKMQHLINDLLEINRIERGQAIIKRQKVEIKPLLRKVRLDFAQQVAQKSIDLVIEEVDAIIMTDADCLTRILENLLSNAIKFSPPMKKVLLKTSAEPGHLKFAIVDEGPGIPLDEQPRLFDKFQRLSNRPTNSESSTGLGLSIVKELTGLLGGEITFRTEIGQGSTFVVTLPNVQRSRHLAEQPAHPLQGSFI